ncbi:MAG TPA: NADH-quinone oxidoreductase subunit M, partial [Armatimonadetes bacterium]|nr:NADH-quinone oxidoreductase subunit M [Armatimonadota bacterium]
MTNVGILTAITFLPALGAVLIAFTPRDRTAIIRATAHFFASVVFILSLFMFADLDRHSPAMQFQERFLWIPFINVRYYLGVDGLSAPLVVLTALLTLLSIIYSPTAIRHREKEYYALFLLLETGMIGVFTALDLIFFYVFWEVSLVPMYFLIGIWGGPKREYAAIKFFLYTLFGSVLMLLAILTVYYFSTSPSYDPAHARTFDIVELIRQQPLRHYPLLQVLVFLGFYIGFAIKVPVFPFHTWLPDAHVEAPTAGSVI